ncbi:MAG: beta-galactosidase, partial [Victivallales bacterium]
MMTKQINKWAKNGLGLFAGTGMAVIMLSCWNAKADAETTDLRGYGKVEATITPQRSEFICESEEKADILLGKLLADMFWEAKGSHVEKTVNIKSGWLFVETISVPVHLYPPYGALIAGRNRNRVMVFGGKDEQESISSMKKDGGLSSGKAVFKPAKQYPMFLDFYDLRAFQAYTLGLHPENKYLNGPRMQFVEKFFTGGLMGSASVFLGSSAPGADSFQSVWDTDADICEKADQMFSLSISTGVWPTWARNKWPECIDQDSDSSPTEISLNPYLANPESYGITPEQRSQTSLKFLKDVLLRYKDRNVLGGLQLYCSDYFYESCFGKGQHDHLGYSAAGREGFRGWLREVRGYSLKDLGERWYGASGHFKDWNEVELPEDINGFFGDMNGKCLRIKNNWLWKKADADQTEMPPDSVPGWIPVEEVPSRKMFILPAGPAFWRVSFDAEQWLKENVGKDMYLVCNINNGGWKEYQAWLNGKALGKFKSKTNPYNGPFALKVTGLLTSGVNRLGLSAPGGRILGPVFLTTTKPQGYPYLGKQQNARYVDMLEWQLYAFNSLQVGAMEYARSIEPDRPFAVCAASNEVKDGQGDALSRLGGSMQDTGFESSYRPFNSRMGYAGGFYGSCEASGIHGIDKPATFTAQITRMLSWILINGEGSHMLWRDPYYYFEVEKKTGWFTKNKRNIQLVGKYLPEKPDIAILCSSRSALLGYLFHSMGEWDIGRGELHACHYDNVYVTETMLAKGMADDYPVLFDTDTMFMGQDTIDSIRKYVEKGGTFVALHNSGRHGILEPDSWPISELTGFKVLALGKKGKIKFEKELPLFKGWEGKEFEGEGSALDWKDSQSAKDVSVGLEPLSKGTVALARWEDGTVAVGMRTLGKGKVIVLGSTFWRYGRDLGGTGIWKIQDMGKEFLERLFTDLGVKRTATASDKGVFARKIITKNGLQEGLIVMDALGSGMKADAGFATAEKPSEVWD